MLDKITALITAALGLVAALAWNDAIQSAFALVFGPNATVAPKFGYAVIVTILAVVLVIYIGRAASRARKAAPGMGPTAAH